MAFTTSPSSCERNWSTYGFTHSKACNKLLHTRADKLVRVFSNLKLLTEYTLNNNKEERVEWQYADAPVGTAVPKNDDS